MWACVWVWIDTPGRKLDRGGKRVVVLAGRRSAVEAASEERTLPGFVEGSGFEGSAGRDDCWRGLGGRGGGQLGGWRDGIGMGPCGRRKKVR